MRFFAWLLLLLIPFLIMIGVNSASPAPTHSQIPDRCTRFCHDHGCPHNALSAADAQNSFAAKIYAANIRWLKRNPFGLSYKAINLLIYVILLPGLMAISLWGLIRKRRRHG